MASDEKLFSDKDIAKIGLSVGVDALLKNETEVSDNEKYRLYVKYQQFEGKITKEEADKQIKDIRDNKYLDVDDANAWVASTVASGENIYKVKGYRIDDSLDNETINPAVSSSKNAESKEGSGISAIKKWAESKVKEQNSKSNESGEHTFDTRDNELIKKNIDTSKMARQLGIDESHIINDLNMTELEKQQNVYLKTDLSDKETITKIDNRRLDDIVDKDTREFCEGVTITGNKDKVDVQSEYLGNFTYDPKEFALGYKEIAEKDGSKSKLPVLEYIAGDEGEKLWDFDGADKGLWRAGVSSINIPDGLKNMDYMFANQEQLRYMPEIPKSVTSAHYSFVNCKNMYVPQNVATEHGENWNIGDAVWHTNYRVKLPDGLEDMSGMFKNSTQFRANFEKLPVNLKNGTDAFKGCEELGGRETHLWGLIGQDLKAPQFGTDITPYLTSQYAKDIMGDISNEKVKQYGDNTDFYINKDGTFNSKYKDKIDY